MAALETLRQAFFEECEDLLSRMAEGLGHIPEAAANKELETIHDVFRAVHSIKGGAGAFGLTALVSFAHAFETVLDLMRSESLYPDAAAVHTLLRASDVLADLVAAARDGRPEPAQMPQLLLELDLLAEGGPVTEGTEPAFDFQPVPLDFSVLDGLPDVVEPDAGAAGFAITLRPTSGLYAAGHDPVSILRSLSQMGDAKVVADVSDVASLSDLDLSQPRLSWHMELATTASLDEIEAVFEFVTDNAEVTITPCDESTPQTGLIQQSAEDDPGFETEQAQTDKPSALRLASDMAAPLAARAPSDGNTTALAVPASIRVNLDRVDRLINQIGELVIMEAMLSQTISHAGLQDDGDITASLEGIKQLAGSIQESVMSIRAQPLKSVFQRMERITREAADATGKQVRLVTLGEATEVDKTVIERLVDPLTHMIRNSVDHGIETAERRLLSGKPVEGVITLSAAHRSGRVIIEIVDDGAGINRGHVREIAEQRGLILPGAQLAPSDIDNLLFMPGFSSKSEVSALSGRGVGLDVVRREIQALGGRVSIQSTPGHGTSFTIALPLTLAVLEGMLIGVGGETMVLPISAIIETLQLNEAQIHRLGRTGRLVATRGDMIPIIDLAESFGFPPSEDQKRTVLILVECDTGFRAALAADQIFDQRQVVIKSLEDNYGSVPGISAATILGDGRIALIVDPEEIVQRSCADIPATSLTAIG